MSPQTEVNLCYWIGGIQAHKLDTAEIMKTASAVDALLPQGMFCHKVFNWEDKFFERQTILWGIAQKHGGFWTKIIKRYVSFLGMDMGWYLSTNRGMVPGFLFGDLHMKLKEYITNDISIAESRGLKVKLWLISHSWGTKVALDYVISNPDEEIRMVTFGSPLSYLSGAYEDWGDPRKIKNVKSWTNIYYEDDPVSAFPFRENPGPYGMSWSTFVNDVCLPKSGSWWSSLNPKSAIESHMAYWGDSNFTKVVSAALLA